MIASRTLTGLLMVLVVAGCETYKVAGRFQSGRQAFVARKYDEALAYFQQVADANPNYMFQSVLYRQGIWSYLGRAQYHVGNLAQARQSLERAISLYPDDYLARIYLGLILVRSGDNTSSLREMENGMKGLHGWLEYMESSQPYSSVWDPRREIRTAIEKDLAMISRKEIPWQELSSRGEWLGPRMEDEIDRVRRQESERDD
ncbi:MAG: tetratricopeptide repeat protein [Candidatus Binatia bacterium]